MAITGVPDGITVESPTSRCIRRRRLQEPPVPIEWIEPSTERYMRTEVVGEDVSRICAINQRMRSLLRYGRMALATGSRGNHSTFGRARHSKKHNELNALAVPNRGTYGIPSELGGTRATDLPFSNHTR